MIDWTLPIKLVTPNIQEHWTKKHKRNKQIQRIIWAKWKQEDPKVVLPCKVTLTRIGPRLWDDMNNIYAFKSVQDYIADLIIPNSYKKLCTIKQRKNPHKQVTKVLLVNMGKSDSDPGISWHYEQKRGLPKQHQIRIQIDHTAD